MNQTNDNALSNKQTNILGVLDMSGEKQSVKMFDFNQVYVGHGIPTTTKIYDSMPNVSMEKRDSCTAMTVTLHKKTIQTRTSKQCHWYVRMP
jgi:hypothetical protein